MIPEFITAKPATNRKSTDAPPVPDSNSADQLQNKAAFQKALHERTSERPAEQQAVPSNDVRPEESRQPTSRQTSNESSHEKTSQGTSTTARNEQPGSAPDSANSTTAEASRTDVNRESEIRGQNDDTENSLGTRKPSKQIRRIDPANHSTSNDAATRPSENAVERTEVAKPTSEAVIPNFISTDDLDIGTLPSLFRSPVDDVTASQVSADVVSADATPGGESIGVPAQRSDSPGQNSSNVDSELRPFLNDSLIPDTESVATDARFTATDPSLITGDTLASAATDNVVPPVAGEELSAIPTLPSLRPEVTSTVSTSLPIENHTKNSETPVIENVAGNAVAEGILRSAERSSAATPTDLEPSAQSPNDSVVAVDDSPSAELPLVLPSLVSNPKRRSEAPTRTEDPKLSNEQTGTRQALTQSSPATIVPAVNESSPQVPTPPQVEASPIAQQNVSAEKPPVADSTSSSVDDSVNDFSKNSTPENPIVVSPVEPSVREPANEVSRQATEDSDSSAIVERTASSSGDIDSEQSVPRPEVTERIVAERDVRTVSDRGESSQPAEVELAPAAKTPEEAVNVQSRSREAIVSAESNVAPPHAQRASASEDRQTVQKVASSAAAANSVVVESVQLESSSDDSASERASTPAAEVNETASRKRSIDASPNQNSTRSADSAQANPARPEVAGQSVVETSTQTSPQHPGAQPSAGASIAAPGDELPAEAQARPTATTTVERVTVEPRADNNPENSSVSNGGAVSVSQTGQAVSPTAIQSASVIDSSGDAAATSPLPAADVASVSIQSAPADMPTNDGTGVSNVQATPAPATATAATSNASAPSEVVREPAVPMEIQDAVSAIQEATSGDSHIRVRLNPRELGSMLVDVSRTENGVVARLEVESAAARVAVLETLPDLQQSLTRSGSTVDRVEVVLTETRAESGRQESDQSQPREQQSRQERQSSNQQARDEQNERREQNQRRDQREDSSSVEEDSTDNETPEQLDIKL